VAEF
jgi:hypothetical protein